MTQTPEPQKRYRTYTFSIRLTAEEHEKLDHLAGGANYSDYARGCLFGELAVKRRTRNRYPVKDHVELSRLLAWLGSSRIANNLNQIAHGVNAGIPELSPETLQTLLLACQDIRQMKSMALKALGLHE